MKRFSKGQGTLEYVIILAAVVAAIILAASVLGPKISNSYANLGDKMQNKVDDVTF